MRTRTTPARALPVLGAIALLVMALAGCLKIDGDLTIEGDTVSGTLLTVLEKDAAEQFEMDPDDVFASENDRLASLEGVSTAPFDDGTWAGTELTFDQVALDDLNQLSDGDPIGPRITRDESAGSYEFSMVTDFAWMAEMAEQPPPEGEEVDVAALLETFDVTIAVTFPGEVTEHNGELSGTTVTWTPPAGERTELRAVAQGAEGGGDGDPGGQSSQPDASTAPGEPSGSPGNAPGDQELTSGSGEDDGSSSTVPLVVGVGLAALVAAVAAGWWFFLRPRQHQLADAGSAASGTAEAGSQAPESDSGNPTADGGNQPAEPDVE